MPKPEFHVLRLGTRGRMTLPPEMRERLGVKPGNTLTLTKEADGSYWLKFPPSVAEQQVQGEAQRKVLELFGTTDPEDRLTDEEVRAQRKHSSRLPPVLVCPKQIREIRSLKLPEFA